MRLGRSVMFGPFEDDADLSLLFTSNAFSNNRVKPAIIAMKAWWKPKRDAEAVAGALRRSCFERVCSKGSE